MPGFIVDTLLNMIHVMLLQNSEAYVCIYSHRRGDTILFTHEGGVDIGDVDAKAKKLEVPVGEIPSAEEVKKSLLTALEPAKQGYVNIIINNCDKMQHSCPE